MNYFDKITNSFGSMAGMVKKLEAVEGKVEKNIAKIDKGVTRWVKVYNRILKYVDDKVSSLEAKVIKLNDFITSMRTDINNTEIVGEAKKIVISEDAKKCTEAAKNFRKLLG